MPQMSIFKVLHTTIRFSRTTIFLLLDEQQQRLLALQGREQVPSVPLQITAAQGAVPAEPLTSDFLASVLHALGGVLEEIAIDTLPNERLSARLHLRDQRGLHSVNANLNDALRLAHPEQSRISVSEEVLARRAVSLADYGATEQESLAEISRRAEQDPDTLRPPAREPLNLDFSNGLRGWHFHRDSAYGSYALDPHTTLTGKTSLAITLHQPYTHGSPGVLFYTGFLAEQYRGQRVRLSAYVKIEQMHQPALELYASWPTGKISPITGTAASASCLTRSHIVPHALDSSWTRHEMVIDVPEQARSISFELGTYEQGKLWLDGIEFVIVGRSVPLTGTILYPPPSQPLNLDFSNGLEYWEMGGSSPRHYELGIDTTVTASAYLKSIVEIPVGSCILRQTLSLENYLGKVVRLTASLKTLDVVSHAKLFIGSFAGSGEDCVEQALTGTTSWTPSTLDWHVPAEEDMGFIIFGVSLQGSGQLWIRDVHLQTVEVS